MTSRSDVVGRDPWGLTHETRASGQPAPRIPFRADGLCRAVSNVRYQLCFSPPRHASDSHTCVRTKHDETMSIFFTSGTSGSPKMTGHTHSSYGLGLSVNGRYRHRTAAGKCVTLQR